MDLVALLRPVSFDRRLRGKEEERIVCMFFQKIAVLSKNRYWAFGALLFWMGVIFSFSMLSGKETTGPTPLWYFIERKGAHVVEYGVLTILAFHYFQLVFTRERFQRVLVLASVWALAYGVTDELHQFFVPFRGAKFTDVGIDGVGIILAGLMIMLWTHIKNRSK